MHSGDLGHARKSDPPKLRRETRWILFSRSYSRLCWCSQGRASATCLVGADTQTQRVQMTAAMRDELLFLPRAYALLERTEQLSAG